MALTDHIPLPDETKYRRVHYTFKEDERVWIVTAGPTADQFVRHRVRRLILHTTSNQLEARAVAAEMQIRLSVARALQGLDT